MKFRRLHSMIALCLVLSAGTAAGCGLPKDILQPVEEVVSTVKKNIELKQQMNALALPKEVKSISKGKYAYESLSKENKVIYDQMLDAILLHEEETALSSVESGSLEDVFNCIKADYGGLFWVDSFRYTQYQRNGETEMMSFSPNYTMTLEKRGKIQKKIDRQTAKFLKRLKTDASDYEKARYVYRELILRADYNLEAPDNQNIISVFLGRETVCQGYASAMQYLMEKLGIPCVIVTGTAKGGSHAWNLLQLDGEWYYADATWGNSKYHDNEKNDVKYVEYDYLNITTEEMLKDHQPQMKFELPKCTAVENNYYVREGRYYTSMDETVIAEIGALLKAAYEKGEKYVSVKFSGSSLCSAAKQYFLTEYHINEYCGGLESVYYKTDTKMNIFVVIFP